MSLLQKQLQQHSFFQKWTKMSPILIQGADVLVVGDPPLYQLIPLSEGIDLQWRVD